MKQQESEDFYNTLKKEGMSDSDIADSFVWSIDKTPEEEKMETELFKKFIKEHKASKPWYNRLYSYFYCRYLSIKYRLQDRWK